MKGSSFSVILIFVVLMIVGVGVIPSLTVTLRPTQIYRSVSVSFSWPGNSARVVEQEVTSVLEGVFARMKGVRQISSTSRLSGGDIRIDFYDYADFDAVRFEVSTLIRQVHPNLPEGVSYPRMSVNRPRSGRRTPVLTYSLNAPGAPAVISAYVQEHILPVLSAMKGVNQVDVSGGTVMEWVMTYDAGQFRTLGISSGDVTGAISRYLSTQPAGNGYEVEEDGNVSLIHLVFRNRVEGELGFMDVPVKKVGERMFFVKDLVSLRHQEREPSYYGRLNGANAIYIDIYTEETTNQLALGSLIKERMAGLEKLLPVGYFFVCNYDATTYIDTELYKNLYRTLATLLILLCFVWIVSRQFRYLFLIVSSLVANLSIAAIFYYLFGIGIHIYTLAGVAVSLGLIIDNSIVMIDHWAHHRDLKVFLATLAGTLTTMAALVVVFFLDENARLILEDFSALLLVNLAVSLAVALFFIPAMMERFPLRVKRGRVAVHRRRLTVRLSRFYVRLVRFSARRRVVLIVLIVLLFGLPVFMLPGPLTSGDSGAGAPQEPVWKSVYNQTLGSTFYREKIKPVADKAFGGMLRVFMQDAGSYSWDRDVERTTLTVRASMPYGSSLEQMDDMIRSVEEFLKGVKEVDQFKSSVSAGSASMSISFKEEYEFTGFPYVLQSELIDKARTLDGADWQVSGVGRGFSNAFRETVGQNRIRFRGYNLDALYRFAEQCRDSLMVTSRVKDVAIQTEETYERSQAFGFVVNLDPHKMLVSGVRMSDVSAALAPFNRSMLRAGSVIVNGKSEDLLITSREAQEMDLWQLQHTEGVANNTFVRLADVSTLGKEYVSQSIKKENQQYLVSCAYDYIGTSEASSRLQKRVIERMKPILPLGFTIEGNANNYYSLGGSGSMKQVLLLLLVIAMIFFIGAVLFESLLQPFAVIFIIPVSYIGLFITYPLFGIRFDQGGFAAFVLLSGITVNAALYIINDYNQLRRKNAKLNRHKTYHQLYVKAFNRKIFPIMLTILSTILGFTPFLINSANETFWPSLAAGTMGGLIFSLVGIFFYLPAILLKRERKKPGTGFWVLCP